MALSKGVMIECLPVQQGDISLRCWTRQDTEARASWPSYPPEYADFNFAHANAPRIERDRHFEARHLNANRIDLAVDHTSQLVIGLLALVDIRWSDGIVGNIGLRIHPEWCDKGWGSKILLLLADWCGERHIKAIRLDVGPANGRALRCYQKVGFRKVGTFWRDEPKLQNVDIQKTCHDDVRPYFRDKDGVPQVQFWWMQLDIRPVKKKGRTIPCARATLRDAR